MSAIEGIAGLLPGLVWVALLSVAGLSALAVAAALAWFRYDIVPAEPFRPTRKEAEQLALYSKPDHWFAARLRGQPEIVDGQRLDPKLQYMMEQTRPVSGLAMPAMQAVYATSLGRAWVRNKIDRVWLLYTKATEPMRLVADREIVGRGGPTPIRIYHPEVEADDPLPLLVFHHGGGWIFSSIAATDRVCRLIASQAKVIVVSVGYRLAPEHPYPAASDDGEDAFLWVRANAPSLGGDPARIGVGGDSAGGHIAINIAQRQLIGGRPGPAAMLLFYPGTGMPVEDRSFKLFGKGYGLDSTFIDFILPRVFPIYLDQKRTGDLRVDDLMDPLRAQSLRGMPPTIISTAGFDILRDSGRAFAGRLEAEGVPVRYKNYPSLGHSFLQFSAVVADADTASREQAELFGQIIRKNAIGTADPAR
ncbi:acetyl esterase [Pseudochelatococcus lubricantis]|uniref:Acetyl esterase n=1 Tax=Pseudochelatococcus lubricantis TaxID=1538102 RepID=A0ABX0UX41_9HYPH|nr:alpha/beta hydrolase [Pseudochelatococcus lubricantis]NIJ57506.1 acetyl esterase [Pseudochelatococcus lubricantis]